MTVNELLELVSQINDATDIVAARIDTILSQGSTGCTPEEVAQVAAALRIALADLQALGAGTIEPDLEPDPFTPLLPPLVPNLG